MKALSFILLGLIAITMLITGCEYRSIGEPVESTVTSYDLGGANYLTVWQDPTAPVRCYWRNTETISCVRLDRP